MQKRNRFFIDAVGIFFLYLIFGILQEKITRGKYSYETQNNQGEIVQIQEKYKFTLVLVFVQCLVNYLLSAVVLKIWPSKEVDKTRIVYYGSVATTYLLAMVCSNMALQWVAYPTQVVGKAAKPIPVLILGVLVGHKSYPLRKYIFITLIVAGVVLFMFKEREEVHRQEFSFGLGEILLIMSLLMDGLTGAIQERIRAESKPSGHQMMNASNFWATIILGVALVLTGEIFQFIEFAGRHPSLYPNILILGLTQAVGQLFLYSMVSDFGPLVVSVVTTTRKFFTVLGSVIIFGNTLSSRQWMGAIVVFTGLFLDAFYSKSAPKKPVTTKS